MTLNLKKNISLRDKHTFRLNARAAYFISFSSTQEIFMYLEDKALYSHPFFILGSGSNCVFTKDFEGVILQPAIRGIQKIQDLENQKQRGAQFLGP